MPKRRIDFFIIDILIFIEKIKRYAITLNNESDLLADELRLDAILRTLGLMGEAMNHILKSKKFKDYSKPSWKKIIGFRNLVIHEYFGINTDEVFKIIKIHVLTLEKEILELIKNFKEDDDFMQAVVDTQNDLALLHRIDGVNYLAKIERLLKK